MDFSRTPAYVRKTVAALEEGGYRALLVGGCVRDLIMRRRPTDWDVATSATPSQVMALFKRSVPTGVKHGTVTVLQGRNRVEVTTFRSDGRYLDGRRPESVAFIGSLEHDLARRDFTINAMAADISGNIVDLFDGVGDIEGRVIRCVGSPRERFEEDALRMFRALRFSAVLGFDIDPDTVGGIRECSGRAAALAVERIRDELEKTLMSSRPQAIGTALELGILDRFAASPSMGANFRSISRLPKSRPERWAGLCSVLWSLGAIESFDKFLRMLKVDSKTVKMCAAGAALAAHPLPDDNIGWKRLLAARGEGAVTCAAAAADALRFEGRLRKLRALLKSDECFSLERLAVDGSDLAVLGYPPGAGIGRTLRLLLDHVIENPQDNKKEILLKIAENKK